jgi:DNA-binding GntR family transcriptional regulator
MPRAPEPKTRVEEAYAMIKQLMLQQRVVAGQKLLYREMVEWLRMSKTPIINALNRLEQEGFIVSEANRGFSVKPMEVKEIRDAYDVREALETKAVQQAVQLGRSREFELLSQKVKAYEDYRHYKYDKKKFMLNAEIHLQIAAMADNQALKYLLRRNLEHPILRVRLDNYSPAQMAVSVKEHARLLELMQQRQVAQCVTLVRQHILQARDQMLACVSQAEVESKESQAFFED